MNCYLIDKGKRENGRKSEPTHQHVHLYKDITVRLSSMEIQYEER